MSLAYAIKGVQLYWPRRKQVWHPEVGKGSRFKRWQGNGLLSSLLTGTSPENLSMDGELGWASTKSARQS